MLMRREEARAWGRQLRQYLQSQDLTMQQGAILLNCDVPTIRLLLRGEAGVAPTEEQQRILRELLDG